MIKVSRGTDFKKRTLENLKEKSTLEKSRGILKTTKGKKQLRNCYLKSDIIKIITPYYQEL